MFGLDFFLLIIFINHKVPMINLGPLLDRFVWASFDSKSMWTKPL